MRRELFPGPPEQGRPRALCIEIPYGRGDESFADDLNMGRGIVSGRVALLLRSAEIPPPVPMICPATAAAMRAAFAPPPGGRTPFRSVAHDSRLRPSAASYARTTIPGRGNQFSRARWVATRGFRPRTSIREPRARARLWMPCGLSVLVSPRSAPRKGSRERPFVGEVPRETWRFPARDSAENLAGSRPARSKIRVALLCRDPIPVGLGLPTDQHYSDL